MENNEYEMLGPTATAMHPPPPVLPEGDKHAKGQEAAVTPSDEKPGQNVIAKPMADEPPPPPGWKYSKEKRKVRHSREKREKKAAPFWHKDDLVTALDDGQDEKKKSREKRKSPVRAKTHAPKQTTPPNQIPPLNQSPPPNQGPAPKQSPPPNESPLPQRSDVAVATQFPPVPQGKSAWNFFDWWYNGQQVQNDTKTARESAPERPYTAPTPPPAAVIAQPTSPPHKKPREVTNKLHETGGGVKKKSRLKGHRRRKPKKSRSEDDLQTALKPGSSPAADEMTGGTELITGDLTTGGATDFQENIRKNTKIKEKTHKKKSK